MLGQHDPHAEDDPTIMSESAPPAPAAVADPIPPRGRLWRRIIAPLASFALGCLAYGVGLKLEPHFIDESAYVSQSFYTDLLIEGRRDDPAWLDYAGYDLPPGAKYLVGLALRVGGYSRFGPAAAASWYEDTRRRFETPDSLVVARIPSVIMGAIGCLAIGSIAARAFGWRAAVLAVGFLLLNPLYRLHARRAMSDVPAEAMLLVSLAFGLAGWSRWVSGKGGRRAWLETALGGGLFLGLATLAKLNGAIAGLTLIAWAGFGLVLPGVARRSRLGLLSATILAGAIGFGLFAALNPFLTARPTVRLRPEANAIASLGFWERVQWVKRHREEVSGAGQAIFPADALRTVPARLAAVAVQGYGRFSPFGPARSDSTRRFDSRQDWGVAIWGPLVLIGLVVAARVGALQRRACQPPTAWAVGIAVAVAFLAVTSFIPLAWDRYYLSLQPGAALLASAALTAPFRRRSPIGPEQ